MARFTKTWFIRNNAATYEAWQDDETAASFSSANLVAGVLDNITASDTLILFDAATFTLEATWNVDVSDIAIIGAGSAVVTNPAISEGTTVLNYTPATGDAITFDRAAGTRLANIQLSGFNLKTTTSTTSIGMRLEGVAGMELGNLSIAGFDGGGIYSEGMWDSVIRHCRIDNCGVAAGAAGATFYSSTAHASFNGTRLVDCTFESCPGPDLVIDDNGSGARPNKINISRCKFETLGNFQDHRIQIADVDFLTWVESNIFTGDSLVGGTPIDQMRLTNVVGSHIKGSRFESSGTVVSIDSFVRLDGCNGVALDSLYFHTGDELVPDTACIQWVNSNDRISLGRFDVPWAGGDTQANIQIHSGAPTSFARPSTTTVQEVSTATTLRHLESPGFTNVDSTAGTVAITLPGNAAAKGQAYILRREGANNVTVNRAGTDTIGSGAATSLTLGSDGAAVGLVSVGDGNWKQVSTEGTVT